MENIENIFHKYTFKNGNITLGTLVISEKNARVQRFCLSCPRGYLLGALLSLAGPVQALCG